MQVLKCTRKKLNRLWVKKESGRIISTLLEKLRPNCIFFFGSAADAKMTDQSDFDFLLVFKSDADIKAAQKKTRSLYPLSEYPVDLVWVTEDRFNQMKHIGGICMVAFEEGKRFTYTEKNND